MKKQIWLIALLLAGTAINSQAQVSVNINIGAQPIWGPVGYDYVEYYYIPDIDAYYDVRQRQYVYFDNNVWITRRSLPPRYSNYDMYGGYKVVINERRPWMHHDKYRTQYVQYRGRGGQGVIRDSRDARYYANPRHPHHSEWKGNPGRGNGNGAYRGHGNAAHNGGQPHPGNRGHGNGAVRNGAQPQPGGRGQGNSGIRNSGARPQPGNGNRGGHNGGQQQGNGGDRGNRGGKGDGPGHGRR